MKLLLILIACLSLVNSRMISADDVRNVRHAIIVATSYTYNNYRHQADAYHAYHVLIRNGVPEENIILFAYDDIATHSRNPFPGKVFNKPDPNGPGADVYAGVKIDYKGKNVSSLNFLNVLSGNKELMTGKGTGRVLESGPSDNVFIYMTDHGAAGMVAFLDIDMLFADELLLTLEYNFKKKRYNKLIFYLEACESGSMFQNLPNNMNIYSVTAANSHESSYAIYCSGDALVNNTLIKSCLGDEFSVRFLEDLDIAIVNETLEQQFYKVASQVQLSHVQRFGDLQASKMLISDFLGQSFKSTKTLPINQSNKRDLSISSRLVKLRYLYDRLFDEDFEAAQQEIQKELDFMKATDSFFEKFIGNLNVDTTQEPDTTDFNCYRNSVLSYQSCMVWGEYTMTYGRAIYNACAANPQINVVYEIISICRTISK